MTTEDGTYSSPPSFFQSQSNDKITSEQDLRAELKSLSSEELLERALSAEMRLKKWEGVASDFVSTLALCPEMTEAYYARLLRDLLSDALLTLDEVDELRHVECSMPCVKSEKPKVEMIEWNGLPYSEWMLEWSPHSWWVSVSAVGSRWGLGFNVLTRVSSISLKGVIRCSFSEDLTALRVSFRETPALLMSIESSVGWGVVPIPVREQIENLVRVEIERFVEQRLTGEENMVVVLRRKADPSISDSDIEEAIHQAERSKSVNLRSGLLI